MTQRPEDLPAADGWFDETGAAISNLLTEKNRLHKTYVSLPTDHNKAAFYRGCRRGQQLRKRKDAWTARRAEEIQGFTDRNECENFFAAIIAVYGPPTKGTAPLLGTDRSTLLIENTNSTVVGRALRRLLQSLFHHLRRRHGPSAPGGDQRRPRPPALPPRNHQDREAALYRKIASIRHDSC
ncbi:hypothetical protein SprV_0702310200 [Sparganum proliferum]